MAKNCLLILTLFILFTGLAFGAQDFKVKKMSPAVQTEEYVPGEVVVKYRTDVNSSDIKGLNTKYGVSEIYSSSLGNYKRVQIPTSKTVEEMVEIYNADPNVEYAEPNYIFHAFMTPNDTYYSYQWHMPMINMEDAWDLSTGTNVVVAIIDCGVAYEDYGSFYQAPDLAGTNFVSGYDFVNNDSHPNDDEGHGTHVAGTVAQTTNNSLGVTGVAFDCSIMPVKVLDGSGSGSLTDVADGIIWAADNGAHVINMSLGSSSSTTTLQNACDYAYNKGVTIVCAAGNSYSSTPQYPASYSSCISVSAVRYDSTLAWYSSYGQYVDVCAPGGDTDVDQDGDGYVDGILQQTHDGSDYSSFGYYFYQGTSMASPHVAGVAALILAKAGGGYALTPDEVQDILQNTAVDLGSSGRDNSFGYGLIDAHAAVSAVDVDNPPVADFSGTPTSGCANLTVTFTDASTNDPTSWSWDFGDGGTSTSQNPSHTYTAAGTYTVELTATNAYGSDSETKTNYITVNTGPTAAFSGSPTSGEAPLTVTFTDASTDATSWSWDFGDGGTSTSENPSHTYTAAGTYTVALTATNACGSDTYTRTDYITVTCTAPTAAFSGSPTSGEVPLEVTFTDASTGATAWSWDFGNGGSSTEQSPSYTYNAEGYYTVALTVTNDCGSDTETKTDYITVTCTAPTAAFSGTPTSGEVPLTVTFTDASTGATAWSWDFGDGGSSTEQSPSYTYNAEGTYTVALTVTNSCGSNTETKTDYITVTCTAPTAAFSGSPTSGDYPLTVYFYDASTGATSWSWDFGDGGTSTEQSPSYTYTAEGYYTVALTVTNDCGSDTETKTDYIYVTEPSGNYASLPYSTGFEDGAFDNYWTTETSSSVGRIQITTSNTPHTGSYHMTMDVSSNGTYSQNEAWLHLNLAGKSDVELVFWWKEFSDETHDQDGVYFSDDDGSSFVKVYSLTGGSSTYQEITLDVDQLASSNGLSLTGTFIVKFQQYDNYVITTDGMAFDDISVTSNEAPPTADFSGDPTSGTVPLTINFTDASIGATSWSWDFGDGGTSTDQNPTYTYNAIGTYTVTLTATNAYGSDTETKADYITVNEQGENAMHVNDMNATKEGRRRIRGYAEVQIVDQDGSPVANATVYGQWSGSATDSDQFTTDSEGWGECYSNYGWGWGDIQFTFCVTDVSKTDWTYDSDANEMTCASTDGTVSSLDAEFTEADINEVMEMFGNSLASNFPNPFNPSTEICYYLPSTGHVSVKVYNILGQNIKSLKDGVAEAGLNSVIWNGDNHSGNAVASGVYFYRITLDNEEIATKRMLLLK